MSGSSPLQPQPPQPSLVENEGVNAGSREVLEEPPAAAGRPSGTDDDADGGKPAGAAGDG